jgi:catechol 2,3-dioxygenase-like lactoylglutathione lyase family enzyme
MAAWYVEHLGMRVVRRLATPPYIHFLADANGRVVIEVYSNPVDPVPDYASMHPLRFHIAFHAEDPDITRAALVAAGATFVDEQSLPGGSRLLMLRDRGASPSSSASARRPCCRRRERHLTMRRFQDRSSRSALPRPIADRAGIWRRNTARTTDSTYRLGDRLVD